MAHKRKEIRDYIVDLIKAASTNAGQKVYANRDKPIFYGDLPAVYVFTLEETSEQTMHGARDLTRTLKVGIQFGTMSSTPDDDADALCLQIETAIGADVTLGRKVKKLDLESTQFEIVESGNKPAIVCLLTYRIEYETAYETDHRG